MTYWHPDDLAMAARALQRPGQPQDYEETPTTSLMSLLVHVLGRLFIPGL